MNSLEVLFFFLKISFRLYLLAVNSRGDHLHTLSWLADRRDCTKRSRQKLTPYGGSLWLQSNNGFRMRLHSSNRIAALHQIAHDNSVVAHDLKKLSEAILCLFRERERAERLDGFYVLGGNLCNFYLIAFHSD